MPAAAEKLPKKRSDGTDMTEKGDNSVSIDHFNHPGITVPPKSSEDGSTESPAPEAPQYVQDLKSVLVTSVLNLEKLDVDLYR